MTMLGLATYPGLFIIQETDEQAEDQARIVYNDIHRRPTDEEWEAYQTRTAHARRSEPSEFFIDELDSTAALLGDAAITEESVSAAALVAIESPELLVTLYRSALDTHGVEPKRKKVVREKIFHLTSCIFVAMVDARGAETIKRSLMMRRDVETGATLLSTLGRFARTEIKHDFRHRTAVKMFEGFQLDPFDSILG